MKNKGLVLVGGFIGSVLRYGADKFIAYDVFPFATLGVNLVGCLLMGWLLTLTVVREKLRPEWGLMLGTGLIGSLTTFSTFSLETLQMFEDGSVGLAILYVVLSIGLGLLLAYTGVRLAFNRRGERT